MARASFIFKIIAIFCSIGLLVFVGLHEYHYSFDPYSWLEAGKASVESRDLWNIRKELYRYWIVVFFIGSVSFGIFPTLKWLFNRKKTNLK